MRRFSLLWICLSAQLFFLSFCISNGCNSCGVQKEQKQNQHQYYLLADSSLLNTSSGTGHPEIIAISELKSSAKIDSSSTITAALPLKQSKKCIQTFDPYTTFIQTLYGTHTEMATTTQCIATIQPSAIFPSPPQQQMIAQCQMPAITKTAELISNNQLLGLIHNQICIQNDRLRQVFSELIPKNISTSFVTKTVVSILTSYSTICTPTSTFYAGNTNANIASLPILSSQLVQCINGGGSGNAMNNPQYQVPPQLRVVVATSTYLLPAAGAYITPVQDNICRPTVLIDSF